MDTFYVPRWDLETLVVDEVSSSGAGTSQVRGMRGRKRLTMLIRAGPRERRGFFVTYAVVLSGERSQRIAIRRKLDRKTRNIELGVDTVKAFLAWTLVGAGGKGSRNSTMLKDQSMEGYLGEVLGVVRQELGLGDAQPSLYSYQITEDAVAAAGTPELQRYLRRIATEGDLSDQRHQRLLEFLEKDFPQEASSVMAAVTATRSREHISAISIHSNAGGLLVTIVNAQGKRLSLLEHKFRDLLAHPNSPRLLHKYTWEDRKRKEPDFIFSEKVDGIVVAKLDTATCMLDVLCLDEESRNYHDRARFVLDLDYACCLYTVLKRIREDRERYERLLEQAEASVGFDPFPGVLAPHYL